MIKFNIWLKNIDYYKLSNKEFDELFDLLVDDFFELPYIPTVGMKIDILSVIKENKLNKWIDILDCDCTAAIIGVVIRRGHIELECKL